jgi:hypothetical protein
MTVCERIDKKGITEVKNVATSPFRGGMYPKSREKVNATLNPIHRHNTADAVTFRIPLDRYFVKVMVWHQFIKACVPLHIREMLRDLISGVLE